VNISEAKSVTVPELALIAATRGVIGFGAGLLLADKFKGERRKLLGWSLFFVGPGKHNSDCDARFREKNKRLSRNTKCIGLLPSAEQV